jgi:Uma2 family endonuclease/predicted nucleic acid-binding protein
MPGARWTVFDTDIYVAALREGLRGATFDRLAEAAPRTFFASVVSAELRAGALDEPGRRAVIELAKRFERLGRVVVPTAASWDGAGDALAKIARREPEFRTRVRALWNDALIAADGRLAPPHADRMLSSPEMSPAPLARDMRYAEYLRLERASPERHEFLRGEVYAMAGGSPEHGALAAAWIGELRAALAGKPCRVFTSDVRVRIQETGLTTYPDVSVVCGRLETDSEDADAIVNPVLLVEVLSDSSEAYDRGAKAAHYRRIPSLREYVLTSQLEPLVEVYRRNAEGRFELFECRGGDTVELASIGVSLAVRTIYANPLAG